jgi:RND family efflux transporter MFP subunit
MQNKNEAAPRAEATPKAETTPRAEATPRAETSPQVETDVTTVNVTTVGTETVEDSIFTSGLLTTENEARLSFKIGGVIDRIFVREGQYVKKGQLLATLKPDEINDQLQQADLALEKAQRDYSRTSNLYKDSVATLEQLQNAQTALELAKRSVETIAFNQQYASIKATSDGFVVAKMANAGEVAAAGAPVLSMDETGAEKDWVLRVGVTDAQWSSVYPGQKTVVRLDAFGDKAFQGSVLKKSRSIDPGNGSFQTDIRIDFNGVTPAEGMFGKATLLSARPDEALTLPYEALIQINGDKAFVYAPQQDGSLKKKEVVIQSFDAREVILKSGLQAGEQVVVSNNAFLNEHSRVAIAPSDNQK